MMNKSEIDIVLTRRAARIAEKATKEQCGHDKLQRTKHPTNSYANKYLYEGGTKINQIRLILRLEENRELRDRWLSTEDFVKL